MYNLSYVQQCGGYFLLLDFPAKRSAMLPVPCTVRLSFLVDITGVPGLIITRHYASQPSAIKSVKRSRRFQSRLPQARCV